MLFPLYIDPGTGSALFSVAIGITAAAYFLIRTFMLKIGVVFFSGAGKESKYKYVIYAEDKRYWMFFESILNEFEKRGIEAVYLTQSQDDPVFASNYNFIKGKYIGQGSRAFAYLNFMSADIVLSTTPDLDVLQWKRSKFVKHYCHLIHAAGGSMLYRLFALDYYDSILLSGGGEIPEIRFLEKTRNLPEKQLIIAGNSYFDMCNEKIKKINGDRKCGFTVLVSPSWGPSALLNVYGEKLLDPLAETGWHIIIRPHPQSVTREKALLEKLAGRYENNPNIEWDYNHENIYSLAKSDVMISDFSGIIYDYVFLFDKPVLFNLNNLDIRPLDAHNLENEPSYIRNIRRIGLEIDDSKLDNIGETIAKLSANAELEKNRREAKREMWQYQGESAEHIVDFLVNSINKGEN
jgi:hypothetical protein